MNSGNINWRALLHFWLWIAAALSLPAGFLSVYWGLAGGSWLLPLQLIHSCDLCDGVGAGCGISEVGGEESSDENLSN